MTNLNQPRQVVRPRIYQSTFKLINAKAKGNRFADKFEAYVKGLQTQTTDAICDNKATEAENKVLLQACEAKDVKIARLLSESSEKSQHIANLAELSESLERQLNEMQRLNGDTLTEAEEKADAWRSIAICTYIGLALGLAAYFL